MAQVDATDGVGVWDARRALAAVARERPAPERVDVAAVDIVTDVAGIEALAADYRHLYRLTGNTLPFATQEWHLAWCEHLLTRSRRTSQEPLFCVARNGAGTCVGLVPLILTRRRLGALTVGALGLVGADPKLTEIRNPLIEPGYERAVLGALQERLARVPGWDWIQWSGVSPALAAALSVEATPQWYEKLDAYVLDLPRSWDEFRSGLRRNVRESLRHCYNSLRRDGHDFELVVARDPVEVRWALYRFLQLHTLRAQMPWGPSHVDRFAAQSLRAFLYGVCERLAARDAVRVFQLRIGATVVASRIGFVVGDGLYLYYSGFDPAWARYSVMTTTVAEALRYAIASGLRSVNLSLTAEQSKLRWHPRRIDFHSALVARSSVRSRLACAVYRCAISGASQRLSLRRLAAARSWS
ncbi:MAG: GNAT family N-acetyltransferase [Gammaproteobacteria bacterium]|nr:GNAT family N-acetyltransferase [Gammaproteobacteria bacterium]